MPVWHAWADYPNSSAWECYISQANPIHYLNTDEYLFILKLIPLQVGHME